MTHLLWVLWQDLGNDRLAQAVTHRLSGITVAPFYGCQLLRPSSLNGEDDPDRPVALEDLVEACGAEAVDYDGRLKCCGWPIGAARDTTSRALAARVVLNAADAGADVIVTPCPLCHSALEGASAAPGWWACLCAFLCCTFRSSWACARPVSPAVGDAGISSTRGCPGPAGPVRLSSRVARVISVHWCGVFLGRCSIVGRGHRYYCPEWAGRRDVHGRETSIMD